MKQPLRSSFDRFGDKVIVRASFNNGDGTIETVVVDLTKLVKETQDNELMKLINRLINYEQ